MMMSEIENKAEERIEEGGWQRVSSCKPYVIPSSVVLGLALVVLLVWGGEEIVRFAVIAGVIVFLGLLALNVRIVHKRGNVYRVSTLFYSEAVTVDDVCLTVKKPGPLWTWFRIHLRKPARFGWSISFVPLPSSNPGGSAAQDA